MFVAALDLEGLSGLRVHPIYYKDDMVVVFLKVVDLEMARNVVGRAVALQREELSLLVSCVLLSISMVDDTSVASRYLLLSRLLCIHLERFRPRVSHSSTSQWSEEVKLFLTHEASNRTVGSLYL